MGQSGSSHGDAPLEGVVAPENSLPICMRLQSYQDLVMLTYEEFVNCIQELNSLSRNFVDTHGKRLVFAVKKGSDATLLWRATVQVACVKVDAVSGTVQGVRLLNLRQFMQVFKTLQCQMELPESSTPSPQSTPHGGTPHGGTPHGGTPHGGTPQEEQACSAAAKPSQLLPALTASMFLEGALREASVGAIGGAEECCICLERKANTTLPCAHAYCNTCIQQWWGGAQGHGNASHNTCPVCREQLNSTEDTWEMADAPDDMEVQLEIQRALEELLDKVPTPTSHSASSSDT